MVRRHQAQLAVRLHDADDLHAAGVSHIVSNPISDKYPASRNDKLLPLVTPGKCLLGPAALRMNIFHASSMCAELGARACLDSTCTPNQDPGHVSACGMTMTLNI